MNEHDEFPEEVTITLTDAELAIVLAALVSAGRSAPNFAPACQQLHEKLLGQVR